MGNFQPLEVVGRGSETQLQMGDNSNNLTLIVGKGFDFVFISALIYARIGVWIEKRQNIPGNY